MEKLDKILRSYVAGGAETKGKLLGAAFIVVNKDGSIYEGAAGRTDLPVTAPKFATDSLTWVASMTKIVTVTCLMQLVEKGLIKLDDDMRPLVPELAKMQILRGFDDDDKPILEDNVKPITLRNLLTHTVGLGYDSADPDLMKWSAAVGRSATTLSFTYDGFNTPLKFAPGEGWYYGTATDWAGKVLETVTGQSLGQYMAENIFGPLGIHDTTFRPASLAERTKGRTVACSYRDAETGLLSTGPQPTPVDPPVESGGAGLHSTAGDYVKVLQALLRALSGDGGAACLVGRETVEEMLRPQLSEVQHGMLKQLTDMLRVAMVAELPPGTPVDHGIGGILNTADVPGKRRKGTMTWTGMCNGHWWIDRETGIAASLVLNVLPQPDLVANELYDELERAGLPSTYNKDLQESVEPMLDHVKTVADSIQIAEGVLATLETKPEKMKAAVDPFMLATDVADYLVRKGVPFWETYHISGRCVALSEQTGTPMNDLTYEQLKGVDARFEQDIAEAFDYERSVEMRSAAGGTSKSCVLEQIKVLEGMLA